ncbi:pentapeptide repeat-containing protein [Saccharopolyspora shandongensis]|uniref:pentapeptide repeat-containing protein n=1 Tax=Saccharopolyspora shandongensis TaxID=418495 RepID=UPI00342D8C17
MSSLEPNVEQRRMEIPVMPAWVIWAGAVGLLVIATVSVFILLSLFGGGTEQDKIRLEVVKLAGSIVIGTGGAVALLLAARRQRTTELDLDHRTRVAVANEHDATERRITELYTAATEQLGSDKAPVRLAGLHALDRLGQTYPSHRQTIIDVFCSYLCMPFTPPADTRQRRLVPSGPRRLGLRPPARHGGATRTLITDLRNALDTSSLVDDLEGVRQELKVRLTAQRLIVDHLRPYHDRNGNPTNPKFWDNLNLDLTGAILIDWDMHHCHVRTCHFNKASFQGTAMFVEAEFQNSAFFDGATFQGPAVFGRASFQGYTWFDEVSFQDEAYFRDASFQGNAWFDKVSFHGEANFGRASFRHEVRFSEASFQDSDFDGATFQGFASFSEASFQESAHFNEASFQRVAYFAGASFRDSADFDGAVFQDAKFLRTSFQSGADFDDATFRGSASFSEASFQDSANFNASFQGDAHFDEVSFRESAWFEMAVFQNSANFDESVFQGSAHFNEVSFRGFALFRGVSFNDSAWFDNVSFQDTVHFDKASFHGVADFSETSFHGEVYFKNAKALKSGTCIFPAGWSPHYPPEPLSDPFFGWAVLVGDESASSAKGRDPEVGVGLQNQLASHDSED